MIGFAVLVASLTIVGGALVTWLWRRVDGPAALEETLPAERFIAGALVGVALWLALSWLLALTHHLDQIPLQIGAWCFTASAAAVLAIAIRRGNLRRLIPSVRVAWIVTAIPIAVWVVYVLWRGTLIPPDNHDALSYHFPKAVFMIREHGFRYFDTLDARINSLPCNYEMLLSDLLLLSGSDRISEWINTVAWLLILAASAAIAERWWGKGRHVAAVVMAMAMTPILLLQSGADKNDLMTCFFAICALLWAGRWYARGGYVAWILTIIALTAGAGTKPNLTGILIGILPFVAVRLAGGIRSRELGARFFVVTAVASVVFFTLCGGIAYAADLIHVLKPHAPVEYPGLERGTPAYGDWANIWRFPILQLSEPFSGNPGAIWVPWKHEYWFWPKYEIYFSSYGVLFSLLCAALPLAVWRYRAIATGDARRERFLYCAAGVVAFILTMPIVMRPLGFFAGHGRYVAFIIPAVLCWTVAPAVQQIEKVRPPLATLAVVALALIFVSVAPDVGENDTFSPWAYVQAAARTHGTRRVWVNTERAGFIVDYFAGPYDPIAVDGNIDIWIYPAMGAHQTRPIEFIPPGPGPVRIPADAQWVMVDRSWHVLWGNPAFTDMGKFWRYIGKGRATQDDLRVIRALQHDPRFQLIYYNSRLNQAVFYRRHSRRIR